MHRHYRFLAVVMLMVAITAQEADASWLSALGKALKGADEAAGAAKGANTASTIYDANGAAKAAHAPKPTVDDSLTSFVSQHPWASTQLAKCVSNLEPLLTKAQALHNCHTRYQQCVDRQRPNPGTSEPNQSCVQEANR